MGLGRGRVVDGVIASCLLAVRPLNDVSEESARNADPRWCAAAPVGLLARAYDRSSRPLAAKLATKLLVRVRVEQALEVAVLAGTDRLPAACGTHKWPKP